MKKSSICATAICTAMLAVTSVANAGVYIVTGSMNIQLTDSSNVEQRSLDAGFGVISLVETVVLPGTGASAGSLGVVQYDVSGDAFSLTNTSLTRTGQRVSKISGEIIFLADAGTNFDISGFFRFAEYGSPGLASISTELVDIAAITGETTLFKFSNQNSSATVGELVLGTTSGDASVNIGDQTGVLSASAYRWRYELIIDGVNYPSSATAVATGGIVLNFSDDSGQPPIPEPATVGILACAMGGLMLRRRK